MNGKNEKKNENKKESLLVTKESFCAVCAIFSFLALLILCTRSLVFGDFGLWIHGFLLGVFGYTAYPCAVGALYLSITGLIGKRFVKNRRFAVCCGVCFYLAALIAHTAQTYSWARDGYLLRCFFAGEAFPAATACGWIGGILAYGVSAVMSSLGAIVVFSAGVLFTGYLGYLALTGGRTRQKRETKPRQAFSAKTAEQTPKQSVTPPVQPQSAPVNATYGYADGYGMPSVPQTPRVSLQEEAAVSQGKVGNGFSPFANFDGNAADMQTPTPTDSRSLLFGGTPDENYRMNLIFDPNANVNKLRQEEPPIYREYTPSYADAYQNAVNAAQTEENPFKVVEESVNEERNEPKNDDGYSFGAATEEEETITPLRPWESEPIEPSFVEKPSYLAENERNDELFDRNRETLSRAEEFSPKADSETPLTTEKSDEGYRRHDYMDLFSPSNPNIFGGAPQNASSETPSFGGREIEERGRDFIEPPVERTPSFGFGNENVDRGRAETRGRDGLHLFDEADEEEPPTRLSSEGDIIPENGRDRSSRRVFDETENTDFSASRTRDRGIAEESRAVEPPPPPAPPKPRIIRPYVRIPLDDFDCRDINPTSNEEEVEETKQTIIATLEDFKVTGASIASVTFGPTVTRYNVTLPRSISPRKVVALDQSIAINLHSSGVNIYPNYEDGVVSIEVPNKERQFVKLGCMLSGDTFVNAKSSSLMFAMGKNVANRKVYGDISKMIHMLVAGSSGSGKSVFLGSLIISMIYKYSPEELRLILIDPKKTEFVLYNNLPHLMINEIITDVNKAVQSLNWAIGEMNRRYGLFEQMSRAGTYVVNLDQYNMQLEKSKRLPKIVIIIDELADLMLAAKKEMEDRIQNLTQKARAAGIHLIVATQRPSTDVITGVIKSNLPTRIAFYVATDVDSRVILDQSGAQKLLGKGDFLYTMSGVNTPVRVQSAFISPEESQKVVNFIKANNEAYYDEEATAYINNTRASGGDDFGAGADKSEIDPMYIEALRHVMSIGSASISMIQRKCSAGYNRAGKIIEWMEDMGYISAFDGAKARKVLITKEEFESKYGPL